MSTNRTPQRPVPATITWPPQTGIAGNIDPAIDESTIENYPFEGHDQAMVAAQVHIDIARHAASRTNQPESDNDARIAFENAVIAKQCIHYAYLDAGHNYPEPTGIEATMVATADQLLVNNQRAPAPKTHRPEEQLAQDLEIAPSRGQGPLRYPRGHRTAHRAPASRRPAIRGVG